MFGGFPTTWTLNQFPAVISNRLLVKQEPLRSRDRGDWSRKKPEKLHREKLRLVAKHKIHYWFPSHNFKSRSAVFAGTYAPKLEVWPQSNSQLFPPNKCLWNQTCWGIFLQWKHKHLFSTHPPRLVARHLGHNLCPQTNLIIFRFLLLKSSGIPKTTSYQY